MTLIIIFGLWLALISFASGTLVGYFICAILWPPQENDTPSDVAG